MNSPIRNCTFAIALALAASACSGDMQTTGPVSIRGKVTAAEGPLEGAYVAAHAIGKTFTNHVMTDQSGQFTFRGLAPGSYAVFTRIPGFRDVHQDNVVVQAGAEATADFQVEVETDYLRLAEQASNSELMESFPGTPAQKEGVFIRCDGCHGAYYIANSKFSRKDWLHIISKMDSNVMTSVSDPAPPPEFRRGGGSHSNPAQETGEEDYFAPGEEPTLSDNNSIADYLAEIRGPDSPDIQIQFQLRASGELTRAVVVEYQIPRRGAWPHDVQVDPNGRYVWYNDWRANYLGRVDIESGEIKEYPIPGRDDRPPGFLSMLWDHEGNLWSGQLWSGRVIRFNVKEEKYTGGWGVPQEWARTGTVGVCRHFAHPDGPVWVDDALLRKRWTLDPETGKFTPHETKQGRFACDTKGNIFSLAGGKIVKTTPGTREMTEYPTPTPDADPHRLTVDGGDNVWYGDWEGAKIGYWDTQAGKITEYPALTPWSRVYNAVGDHVRKVGYAVPHVSERVLRVDVKTGQVTEYPLPSRGHAVRNVDIDMSTNPPTIWFINQRHGRIVSFQEYAE